MRQTGHQSPDLLLLPDEHHTQVIPVHVYLMYLRGLIYREKIKEFQEKERMFTSLVDLITMAIFLSITPQVKEGFNTITR